MIHYIPVCHYSHDAKFKFYQKLSVCHYGWELWITVDEFKRKEMVMKQLKIEQLPITSPAAHSTNVFCSKVEAKLTFHCVSLTKHCMRRRDCRVPLNKSHGHLISFTV